MDGGKDIYQFVALDFFLPPDNQKKNFFSSSVGPALAPELA